MLLAAAVPLALDAVDEEIAALRVLVETDVVKNEELQLGAHVAGVADAGALEIVDRLAGDVARIAGIVLVRDGVQNVADHRQRGQRREGV